MQTRLGTDKAWAGKIFIQSLAIITAIYIFNLFSVIYDGHYFLLNYVIAIRYRIFVADVPLITEIENTRLVVESIYL